MIREGKRKHRPRAGFTLVEIMIVVLIIGLLLSIATPSWMRSRERSQHRTCLSNLRIIDHAKEQYAMEQNKNNGDPCTMADIWPDYIKNSPPPACPTGGTYTVGAIGETPTCSYQSGIYPHNL